MFANSIQYSYQLMWKEYFLSSNNISASIIAEASSTMKQVMHDNISRSTAATSEIQGENQHVNGKKL